MKRQKLVEYEGKEEMQKQWGLKIILANDYVGHFELKRTQ
jgi:hypothetical protein